MDTVERIICQAAWLGCLPYETAWRMQERISDQVAKGERAAALMLLEHPHTFTAGRATRPGHLLWNRVEMERRDVAYFEVDRGGDITYHGPGQLVGYPILQLPAMVGNGGQTGTDTVGYIRKLEAGLIQTLADFGIAGLQREGFTGIWTQANDGKTKKIASIGVKVDVNRVTRHGFALNVDPDMNYWNGIIACGLEGVAMTSMAACLGTGPRMTDVVEAVGRAFANTFNMDIQFNSSL